MLVLKKTAEFTATINIHQPGAKDGSIKVTFEKIPQDEREDLVEDGGVYALLNRVVKSVHDVEVEGSTDLSQEEIKQIVLNDTPCSTAIIKKYSEEVDGLGRKNSKRRR
jgi:hypothetical protein